MNPDPITESRSFETWCGSYHVTAPASTETHFENERVPRYACSNTHIYNKFYERLLQDEIETHFHTKDLLQELAIPTVNGYNTYFDYEDALIEWYFNADRVLQNKNLQLPQLLGRYLYRPKFTLNPTIGSSSSKRKENTNGMETSDSDSALSADASSTSTKNPLLDSPDFTIQSVFQAPEPQYSDQELSWECQTMPSMPTPDDYDTFAQYEASMIRWAGLCYHSPILPPSATELASLIPITVIVPEEAVSVEDALVGVVSEPKRVGLVLVPFWEFTIPTRSLLISIKPQFPINETNVPEEVTYAVYERITQFFDDLMERRSKIFAQYGSYARPCVPKIHGTFPKPDWAGGKSGVKGKNMALRRLDLTDADLDGGKDCPDSVNGQTVEFENPDYDLETFDFPKVMSSPETITALKEQVLRLNFQNDHWRLYSWYWPNVAPEVINQHLGEFNVLQGGVDVDRIKQLLQNGLFLDKFQDLLDEDIELDSGSVVQKSQMLLNSIPSSQLAHLLRLFECSANRLTHAKLSSLIYEALQSSKAKDYLEYLISSRDIKSLSYVAYAMTFLSEIPVDLFPYRAEPVALATQAIGDIYKEHIETIFIHYYLRVIDAVIVEKSILFVGAAKFIASALASNNECLVRLMQENPDFLQRHLFPSIGHRSKAVSALFLFLVIQLLRGASDPALKSLLSEVDLIGGIKLLARTKFTHAKFAVRRLVTCLASPSWLPEILSRIGKQPQFIQELLEVESKSGEYIALILDLIILGLHDAERTGDQSYVYFLLDTKTFKLLLSYMSKSIESFNHSTVLATKMVSTISKFFSSRIEDISFGVLDLANDEDQSDIGVLHLGPSDLQCLLNVLIASKFKDQPMFVDVHTNILLTLRYLIKVRGIVEHLQMVSDFHTGVLHFCKHSDPRPNRVAWNLIYTMIKCHPGTVDWLRHHPQKLLNSYFDTVTGTCSLTILQNCFRCITRILSLPQVVDTSQKKPKMKKNPELVSFISFIIQSHYFIKIHMSYKRLIVDYPGAAFSQLVSLYTTINTSPDCAKLLKDVSKTEDFKEGLKNIKHLVRGEETTSSSFKSFRKFYREAVAIPQPTRSNDPVKPKPISELPRSKSAPPQEIEDPKEKDKKKKDALGKLFSWSSKINKKKDKSSKS